MQNEFYGHQLGHIREPGHRADIRPSPGDPHLQVRGRAAGAGSGPVLTPPGAAPNRSARAPEHLWTAVPTPQPTGVAASLSTVQTFHTAS